ncbi:MAG: BTAD domain-containing putative transcriptional regulator, partial [Trueperaceae bacterium]
MAVSVRLLGTPSIRWDGADHEPPATRTSALAYYLAFEARWVPRDELLALFWPEVDETRARTNLRQLLTTLRRMPYFADVEVEVSRVRWLAETDLAVLRARLVREPISKLAAAEPPDSPGTLLDGFIVRLAEGFDGWLQEERARLLEEFRGKWLAAADAALQGGRVDQALAWWSGWLQVEPLDEPVVGSFLRYCRAGGRAAEGLRTFESFRTRLERELGLDPTDELAAMARDLRQASGSSEGAVASTDSDILAPVTTGTAGSDRRAHRELDVVLPPLVGRAEELKRLLHELRLPGTVVALVAPGGMGKTRLAQEVLVRLGRDAAENAPRPEPDAPEGDATDTSVMAFVALVDVTTVDEAAAAVASTLAPGALRALPPRERARAAAAGRRAMIVLDNVEQIEGIEELVDDLRGAAPASSWLLTSRVAPRLSSAVTMFLGGLPTPEEGDHAPTLADLEASPAARLFLERARAPGRPVNDTEAVAVAKLTRAVGGMPLALELAAGWSQVLALPAVREKMAAHTGDAPPPGQHLPERHGSLARVFDRTWQQLPDALQDALLRLGVFVGGCTAEAAADVAGVDLGTVAELRRHALIEVTQDGRLTQHPVVRQCIVQRMDAENDSARLAHVREAHARYYVRFMQRMEAEGQATGGAAEIAALVLEHKNLEAGWAWAVEHGWWDELMVAGAMTSISYGTVGMLPRWLEMANAARSRVSAGTLPWCWFETVKTNFAILAATISAQEAYESMRSLLRRARAFDHPLRVGWISHFAAQAAARYGKRAEARAWTQDTLRFWSQAGAIHLLPMAAELALALTVDLTERQRAMQTLADATD